MMSSKMENHFKSGACVYIFMKDDVDRKMGQLWLNG